MRHCICHYSLVRDTLPALEIVYRLMTEWPHSTPVFRLKVAASKRPSTKWQDTHSHTLKWEESCNCFEDTNKSISHCTLSVAFSFSHDISDCFTNDLFWTCVSFKHTETELIWTIRSIKMWWPTFILQKQCSACVLTFHRSLSDTRT